MLRSTLATFSDSNGKARTAAITGTVELSNLIPPTVSYESRGDLLIVGDQAAIVAIADQFSALNSVTLLATQSASSAVNTLSNLYFSKAVTVKGYLGAFEVTCVVADETSSTTNLAKVAIGRDCFDMLVDLTETGLMQYEIPVPGYYAVGSRKDKLAALVDDLPDMMGTFDKPKYFRFNPDACAHSSRGVTGCTRCLDACPAGALSSDGVAISIDPYICQGVGTCATACPTEAISYAFPEPENTQNFVQRVLSRYQKEGGEKPTLLFFGHRDEAAVNQALALLPTTVIPVALEELATVGIDTWFSALAYGAHQILLATNTQYIPATIDRVLTDELAIAQGLLTDMGFEADRICLFDFAEADTFTPYDSALIAATTETLTGTKRDKLFAALEMLCEQSSTQLTRTDVPANAPYGAVVCNTSDCTLCMSCVAVCPTRALHAIGDRPGLKFVEADCVQCGMCQKACPEKAMTLAAGFNWDWQARKEAQLVHEEPAACCIRCEKAFAPASMVKMMIEKLQSHSHFQGAAISRLSMCEDCRVRDIFESMNDEAESQLLV